MKVLITVWTLNVDETRRELIGIAESDEGNNYKDVKLNALLKSVLMCHDHSGKKLSDEEKGYLLVHGKITWDHLYEIQEYETNKII